jgi:predicted ArsR family transcriptional regulator
MKPEIAKTSRSQILRLLRRAPHTVNDLALALGVTDNAVREHLARLERDGFVRQVGRRPGFRKPESIYDITPEAERLFPKSYAPALETLLAVLESRLDEQQLDAGLREAGRRLAEPHLESMKGLSAEQRVKRTLEIIEEFGGLAELGQRDRQAFVIGFGCPFSEIVNRRPKLCLIVQALVGELLGREVREQCQRGERSKCCFLVEDTCHS